MAEHNKEQHTYYDDEYHKHKINIQFFEAPLLQDHLSTETRAKNCMVIIFTLLPVEKWSCNRGDSCVVEYTIGRLRDWSL